jgi:acetylornithine/N-succinyldiaminopimelate aminotransferase
MTRPTTTSRPAPAAGSAAALPTPAIAAREAAAILPTYTRQPVHLVSGDGVWVTDDAGRIYLDFLSGLSVTALGHAHPAVAEAVAGQARRLVHTSNLFYTEPQVALAERLRRTLGWADGRVFFGNSGAEANEAAIKLARRHGKRQHPGKVGVVALEGGFHGRTLAALLATGNPAKHEPFQPLGDWVTHVPHDDPVALDAAVDDGTSAVLLEVVQGEGGVRPVPDEVLRAARAACDRAGALLVIDEVQTGLGRLGSWYGWQGTGAGDPIVPDVVCLAKALANGLPIGAIVARGPAAEAFGAGDHASTFGGGPVVCAAANAVIDTIEAEDLVGRAADIGTAMAQRLTALAGDHELAVSWRGRGLLQALVLDRPAAATVTAAALEHGLIVNDVAPDAVRLAPPLVIDEAAVDEMAVRLRRALDDALGEAARGAGAQDQGDEG